VELGVLQNAPLKQASLVAFMKSLTDERVRSESAPFDHPEIFVPNGDPGFLNIPARDANGNAAPVIGVTIDPVHSPTSATTQTLTGTVDPGSTLGLTFDTPASAGPVSINGGTWSVLVSGLVPGANTITVTATNQAGASARVAATVLLGAAPSLTLNPVLTPTNNPAQTVTGTVSAGAIPLILFGSSAQAAPVVLSAGGTAWSCAVSGLVPGANTLTVVAADSTGSLSFQKATITFDPSDGDVNLDGKVDVADALAALRMAVGTLPATADQRLHADVAPLVGGIPAPDGRVDIADALLILRKAVQLVSF
jgi:hypothetical protein